MKKAQLNKFKDILIQQRDEIKTLIQNHHNEIDHHGDEIDVIQAKILARNSAQIIARNQDKLVKIDLALKKIASGTFGDCEACGEPISDKRLQFNPGFNTCVSCAENLEVIRKSQAR